MATLALEGDPPRPWIFSPSRDLWLLLGGPLAGLLLLVAAAVLRDGFTYVWFAWVALLDTPHYFGTYARAFLDRVEFRRRRRLYLGSFAWLGLGPATLLLGWAAFRRGAPWHDAPWSLFLLGFSAWAYWHVVRQHYGFLRLYQAKDPQLGRQEARRDTALLYGGQILPILVFGFRHPELRVLLGLPASPGHEPWRAVFEGLAIAAIAVLALRFALAQLARASAGAPFCWPKVLHVGGVVLLAAVACLAPPVKDVPLYAFGALVTIYHDLQYQAIAFLQQRNRHQAAGDDPEAMYGPAVFFTRRPIAWIAAGLAFGASARLLGCGLGAHPGCESWLPAATLPLFGALHLDALFASVLFGVAMQHYFLDQHLWRLQGNPELRAELGLPPPRTPELDS